MFSFADGAKKRHFSPGDCRSVGRMMAGIHQLSSGVQLRRTNYNIDTLVKDPYIYAQQHFSKTFSEMRFLQKAGDIFASAISGAAPGEMRHGGVHLDIWYDNMSVGEDETLTLFDFDFCGNGLLVYDIAYFLMQLYHIESKGGDYEGKKRAFLEGYESLAGMTPEEKRRLPYAGLGVWLFYFGVQCRRFDNWSNIFLSENYFKRYMSMLRDWLSYHHVWVD